MSEETSETLSEPISHAVFVARVKAARAAVHDALVANLQLRGYPINTERLHSAYQSLMSVTALTDPAIMVDR